MAIKVLVTCVGGGLIPQLVRFLKSSRVYKNTKVYGVDMNPNASGKHFVDYFQPVASGKSKTFTKQIIKICRKYKINLILPGSDDDALNLSKNYTALKVMSLEIYILPLCCGRHGPLRHPPRTPPGKTSVSSFAQSL